MGAACWQTPAAAAAPQPCGGICPGGGVDPQPPTEVRRPVPPCGAVGSVGGRRPLAANLHHTHLAHTLPSIRLMPYTSSDAQGWCMERQVGCIMRAWPNLVDAVRLDDGRLVVLPADGGFRAFSSKRRETRAGLKLHDLSVHPLFILTNPEQPRRMPQLQRDGCTYTSCYCEENVYHLCASLAAAGVDVTALFAVFISNTSKEARCCAAVAPAISPPAPPPHHHHHSHRCPYGASANRGTRTGS
jgi:hypothetical protein